jgi:GT2 family glycosyltransferase
MSNPNPGAVFVAVPAVAWIWTDAATAIFGMSSQLPPGSRVAFLTSGSTIAKKRNDAVRLFLNSGAEHLFFLDSDMRPAADTVRRLLKHERQAVGALYFSRHAPYEPEFAPYGTVSRGRGYRYSDVPEGLVRADWCGAGALLIHRSAIDAIPEPWFEAIESDEGEDVDFCGKLHRAGIELSVDTSLTVPHIGVAGIDGAYAATWRAAHPNALRPISGGEHLDAHMERLRH